MSCPETSSIIDYLESESYLKPSVNEDVKNKIEEFSSWFNSTARLYLLRCPPKDSETFIYLLLNLKKTLRFAISEINRSISNKKQSYPCRVCGEVVEVPPHQNVWSTLQDHPHFEDMYQCYDNNHENYDNGGDSSTTNGSVIDDLSEDLSAFDLCLTQSEPEEGPSTPETSLNSFKFNFVVTYDQRVEETLYPESLTQAARRRDCIQDYTIQRCGVHRGVCLLCPCSLISRGRISKITPFLIKNHVSGQKHLKCASMLLHTNALKQYHEFWRKQDPNFQAHQVYFVPEVAAIHCLKCQLCQEFVAYNTIINHIKDKPHQGRVLRIYSTPEGKLNEVYLLDMQVQVYDGVVVEPIVKKEEKVKEIKEKKPPPQCVFIKFVVEPNSISLPNRYKEHLDLFKQEKELVSCTVCKRSFINDAANVRGHIQSQNHRELSGVPLPKYSFFCEICNTHIKDEASWEDHFIKGPNRHDSMSQDRRQKVAEYECTVCMVVLYGDELSLRRHMQRGGKMGRPRELRLPFSVKNLFKNKNFIESEARRLQAEANIVLDHQEKMQQCLENLEKAVSGIYPNCKVYPFGSRISGLGNNHSDLDVFMDIGEMYLGEDNQDSQSQEQFVKKVAKSLKAKDDFCFVFPIPSARTPIVKMRHVLTDLDCDISFRHGLGVENTKFLRFCIDLQPITQPFILMLKRWSDFCKLNEHITNYGLALMAVFYLQTSGYLLSVKTVRRYNPSQALIIDGWETLNYTVPVDKMKEFVKPYTANMKSLLRDFFYFYSKFDYANQVVCPLLGNTVPKMSFNEKPEENLPVEMKNYIERIQSENGELFRGLSPFCIQDPFDLSHNLTKACQHGTITKLKGFCTLTYEFLESID